MNEGGTMDGGCTDPIGSQDHISRNHNNGNGIIIAVVRMLSIRILIKKTRTFWRGGPAPRSDCPTVPCTAPETVYDHATPRPTTYTRTWPSY